MCSVFTPHICHPSTLAWFPLATCHTHTCKRVNFMCALESSSSTITIYLNYAFGYSFEFEYLCTSEFDTMAICIRWVFVCVRVCWTCSVTESADVILDTRRNKTRLLKLFVSRIYTISNSHTHTHIGSSTSVWRKICCVRAIICFIYLFLSKTIIHLHWPVLRSFHNFKTGNRDWTTTTKTTTTKTNNYKVRQ